MFLNKDASFRYMSDPGPTINEHIETIISACDRLRENIDDLENDMPTYIDALLALYLSGITKERQQGLLEFVERMIVEATNEAGETLQEVKGKKATRNRVKDQIYAPSLAPLLSSISRGKKRAMLEVVKILREQRARAPTTIQQE